MSFVAREKKGSGEEGAARSNKRANIERAVDSVDEMPNIMKIATGIYAPLCIIIIIPIAADPFGSDLNLVYRNVHLSWAYN